MVPLSNMKVSKLMFCIDPGWSERQLPFVEFDITIEQLPEGVEGG